MRKHKGFTMIEMLVIVGCIAALVAIAYPKFSSMMEQNRENTDVVAMQSAQALLETAFDTGLLIDGKPVTEATAENPLYYDPSGKLTWQEPEGYGEGTDSPSGVTWSCCDDYEYNPAASYKGGIIYCYYVAPGEGVNYPGLHVHWSSDGDSGNVPAPNPPVPTITFPTVPAQSEETTEAAGENGVVTPPSPSDDGDNVLPPSDIKGTHLWPVTVSENGKHVLVEGYKLHKGHRYRIGDKIYVAKVDLYGDNVDYDEKDGKPTNWGAEWAIEVTQMDKSQWLSGENNIDEWGRAYRTKENGEKDYVMGRGDILYRVDASGKIHYYIQGVDNISYTDVPDPDKGETEKGGWYEILNCPNGCGAEHADLVRPKKSN